MRICYFGTYRASYSRNQIMIEGLRRSGVEVIECHERLWRGIEDRVEAASGGWKRPGFLWRLLRVYAHLFVQHCRVSDYDVLMVGYPGQLDVFLARLLSWMRRKPMAWDVFMSITLIARERGLGEKSALTLSLIRWLERLACRLPDMLIIDTADYAAWFQETHGVSVTRFRLVPTGADNRFFKPTVGGRTDGETFQVVYYGTFIPNHGVETIVGAARLLADDPAIRFELIGQGPDREKAIALAQRYGLDNVEFVDWLDREELVKRVAAANVCLGVFGTTPQSLMTVQNKIYEGLAMAKPVITGDSRTVRRSLVHGEHVYLCERANPQALADAVRTLKADPDLRQRLAERGYRLYSAQFDLQHNGARCTAYLRELMAGRRV